LDLRGSLKLAGLLTLGGAVVSCLAPTLHG
jgi:hypothetical protein